MERAVLKISLSLVVVGVLAAILVVLFVSARHRGKLHHCRNNLRFLGQIAQANQPLIDPERRGRAFWQEIREFQFKDVRGKWQPIDPDPFVCPVFGKTASDRESPEAIDYRGPNYNPTKFEENRPIAADREGNHPDSGLMLFYDTSVKNIPFRIERADGAATKWLSD